MAIYIITDSASDINQNEFENVRVLPMTISLNGTDYKDGIDITKDEFYSKLAASEDMPVTSLVSPYQFDAAYEELKEGDEAIVITISAALSGTYQSALLGANSRSNVWVIDSELGAAAQKLLVLRGLQLISEGLSCKEIVDILEKEKKEIVLYAVVDTLEYLLKGGRISKTSAVIGGIINIKPILTLTDGKLIAIGKARGSKQSHIFLNEKIREIGGIDFDRPLAVGYSGLDESNLNKYLESNEELLNTAPRQPEVVQIGSTVGTHVGPGAVLVTFFKRK